MKHGSSPRNSGRGNRLGTALAALLLVLASGPAVLAQEEPRGDEPTPEPSASETSPADRESRLALYVEAITGGTDLSTFDASIRTGFDQLAKDASITDFDLDENAFSRAAVGWSLSRGRARIVLRFEGHKEESWTMESRGLQPRIPGVTQRSSGGVLWWTFRASSDGTFRAVQTIPSWSLANDANGDGIADPNEVQYGPAPDAILTGPAPRNFLNRAQTVSATYERDFGGKRISGHWKGGLRYFTYEGNIPGTAWLNTQLTGVGYTDGVTLKPLIFHQETSGLGPTGALEIQRHFFRDRLVLYANATMAFFLRQSTKTDSGTFVTLLSIPRTNALLFVEGRLQDERKKSAWQLGGEAGARIRLVDGLVLHLGYIIRTYQDAVLFPTSILIPDSIVQAREGSGALYKTKDLEYTGWMAGFSFQF